MGLLLLPFQKRRHRIWWKLRGMGSDFLVWHRQRHDNPDCVLDPEERVEGRGIPCPEDSPLRYEKLIGSQISENQRFSA